jgi:hypothetical protein
MFIFDLIVSQLKPLLKKIDLEYEDASKHVIAWQASDAIKNLNITMVDSNNAANSIYVGSYGKLLIIQFPNLFLNPPFFIRC